MFFYIIMYIFAQIIELINKQEETISPLFFWYEFSFTS